MKIRNYLLVLALMFSSFANFTQAAAKNTMTREQAEARAAQIKERVNEIRAMDFSKLDKTQRADLRHELKDIKSEMKQMPVLIVFSGGALLLILILIILLL